MAKITASEWAQIVTSYQRGEKSVIDLAAEFNVSHQAISKGLRERGVTRASRLTENIESEEDKARKEHEARMERAKTSVEKFAKYNDAIVQMVMKRLIEGDRDGDLAEKHNEILVLKNGQSVIAKARKENWDILQIKDIIDEEDSLPDLNIGEYTPDELEAIRRANEEAYLEGVADPEDEDFEG